MPASILKSFAVDPTMARRYDHYMQHAGFGGKPMDDLYLSHMKWYFRWRIVHVGRMLQAEKDGAQTDEEKRLATYDGRIAKETSQLQKKRDKADLERQRAYRAAVREITQNGWAADGPQRRAESEAAWKEKEDAYYRKNQELSQQPSVGKLAGKLRKYDKEFLEDSKRILNTDPKNLTRYQRAIYEAWKEPALTDPEIIAFFDNYVHDSHAGFALDSTHVIDPRILYQGGDDRVELSDAGKGNGVDQAA
jgi:hypothetical protein